MNTNPLYIHIGLPKSGSSFLQKNIFSLAQSKDLISYMDEYNDYISFEDNLAIFSHNVTKVFKKSTKPCVYSKETLIGNPHIGYEDFYTRIVLLKKYFPNAKIIITIRKQDDFFSSIYTQTIKNGFSSPLDKYLGIKYKNKSIYKHITYTYPKFPLDNANWYNIISSYYEIFGKENIIVLVYEELKKNTLDFSKSLAQELNIPDQFLDDIELKKVNKRHASITTKIAYRINPFLKDELIYNKFAFIPQFPLTKYFKKNPPNNIFTKTLNRACFQISLQMLMQRFINPIAKKPYDPLDITIKKHILDMHKENNKKLSKLIEKDLSNYGYY